MKKILLLSLVLVVLSLAVVGYFYYPRLNIITGFAAKNVCSCAFEADRELASIEAEDNDFDPVSLADNEVYLEKHLATSKVFGLKKRKAVYTQGIGCTLLPEDTSAEKRVDHIPNRSFSFDTIPYPYGDAPYVDTIFHNIDSKKLKSAIDMAFEPQNRSRAVLVLYQDHLIAERYAEGFSPETKLLGWSMTKSITSGVLGVLAKQGKIGLDQDHLFPEWENDERSKITLNDLLQMNSGLEWDEDYGEISDVTKMLFLEEDMSDVQLRKPLVGKPGETWNYSSGTTNLLSRFIRDQFEAHQEYLDFWYAELIDKIGMNSMVVETDLTGNFVGSSYAWATPRDWAKFGLLYLHKGNWNGEQILEESWVEYTVTPTNGSEGQYGAQFWLNAGGVYPNVPKDLFSANGFQGQHVFIIPSKDLVVVRFGLVENPEFNIDKFLSGVVESIEFE
ncbi:serine hydrolase domain-containing protein [Salinimicrobium gaetbulicola]|uniref:Serine hydrolase domain-containing protein n=1 Tax=Salinimicrobium gaetbulicola TaxID=999702 RepID=A0ABW3ID66_9FLAO